MTKPHLAGNTALNIIKACSSLAAVYQQHRTASRLTLNAMSKPIVFYDISTSLSVPASFHTIKTE
jgi:hypothetical protein